MWFTLFVNTWTRKSGIKQNMSSTRHHICQIFYTSTVSGFWKFTRKKRVNRDILNLKYYIFGAFTHSIGVISQFSYVYIHICSLYTLSMGKTWFNLTKNWIMLLQFDLKHIHKVNFYPSDNNFTQALLVLLVTNMISGNFADWKNALVVFETW